jgi:hypothetical protein
VDIEKLQIDYVEDDIQTGSWNYKQNPDEDDEWFMIEFIILTNKFKEIKQIRKYSVQSLVGNLGGYIGLCLGYALLHLPSVIIGVWKQMKQICNRQFNKSINNHRIESHEYIGIEKGNMKTNRSSLSNTSCLKSGSLDHVMAEVKSLRAVKVQMKLMELQIDNINRKLKSK